MTYKGYVLREVANCWHITRNSQVLAITPALYDAKNIVDRLVCSLPVAQAETQR